MTIDAHQHFWTYNADEYPWISKGSALERNWLPEDLEKVASPCGISGCIAVQARQTITETEWLLELADSSPFIKGVVGWVDLQSDRVEEQLAAFAGKPKLVGVRHVVQDEPDSQFMLKPAFRNGISKLRQFGLAYDLLVYPKQLPAAIELVREFPEQTFVVDHLAKPLVRAGLLVPWKNDLKALSAAENVTCKVSGLVTEARHDLWTASDFRPYLDTAVAAFGEQRLMFGSDWPVCLLAATYDRVHGLVADYMRQFSDLTQAAFFGGTAARVYQRA